MKKIIKNEKIRVRFAPSPTGFLHIGGARTALINYLFAKSMKGDFILRIDDTDQDRLVKGSINDITKSLRWLSIKWDEGPKVGGPFAPYYQSKRLSLYQKYAEELVIKGKAYYCFCTPARLEILKKTQIAQGVMATKYDGRCRGITAEEATNFKKSHRDYVIRFKTPKEEKVSFDDLLKGVIEFRNVMDDFVILRTDGYPTYHLASVIDDHLMKTTHIIRGDEWIPSTPKHVLLYGAFGWDCPRFVHLPTILSIKGGKLSKREGSVSIKDFRDKGYLAEAIINFIIFLGWNPGSEEEIFSLKELVKIFSMERVGKSPSIFDINKLNYLNGYYIRKKSDGELLKILKNFNPEISMMAPDDYLLKVINVVKSRMVILGDFFELAPYFFKKPEYSVDVLVFGKSDHQKTVTGLRASLSVLGDFPESKWSADYLNKSLADVVHENNLSNGDVFWPIRAALSGLKTSPSPTELLSVLGKKESLERIEKAINFLNSINESANLH